VAPDRNEATGESERTDQGPRADDGTPAGDDTVAERAPDPGSEPTAHAQPIQERSQRRRERILDSAFHVFSRRGYHDTAVDDIARQAETSKGGIYFHFPTKESIFLELMRSTADRFMARVERAAAAQPDPLAQADAALRVALGTFAGHRTMARLLLVDALGAGRAFQVETQRLHERFARLIAGYLDRAVEQGIIEPVDTWIVAEAWFGAVHEVVMRWLMTDDPGALEDAYPTLRVIFLRGVGIPVALPAGTVPG
jgi:AcrR family transcriptional regulator